MVAARTSTIPWRGIIKSSTDDLGPPLCQVDEEESCPALWARQQSSPDPGTESEDYRSPSDKKKQAINQWSWQRHDRKRQTLPYYAWTTYSSSSYYCTIDKDSWRVFEIGFWGFWGENVDVSWWHYIAQWGHFVYHHHACITSKSHWVQCCKSSP